MKTVLAHYVQMQIIEVPDECPTDDIYEMWEWLEKNFPEKWKKEGEQGWIIKEQSRDNEIVSVDKTKRS